MTAPITGGRFTAITHLMTQAMVSITEPTTDPVRGTSSSSANKNSQNKAGGRQELGGGPGRVSKREGNTIAVKK